MLTADNVSSTRTHGTAPAAHPLCSRQDKPGNAAVDHVDLHTTCPDDADVTKLRKIAQEALVTQGCEPTDVVKADTEKPAAGLESIDQAVKCPEACRRLIDQLSQAPFVNCDSPVIQAAVEVAIERSRGRLFGTSAMYRSQLLVETFKAIANVKEVSSPKMAPELQSVHHAILQRRALENHILESLVAVADKRQSPEKATDEPAPSTADSSKRPVQSARATKRPRAVSARTRAAKAAEAEVVAEPKTEQTEKSPSGTAAVLATADMQDELSALRDRISTDEVFLQSYRAAEHTPNSLRGIGFGR